MAIIQSGRFTADGLKKRLAIRSDFDRITVKNFSNIAAQTAGEGAIFEFDRGMTEGRGVQYYMGNPGGAGDGYLRIGQLAAGTGFSFLDTSANPVGTPVAVTGFTNITQPVVTTTTTGLQNGDVVRYSAMTGLDGWCSIDWQIAAVGGASFANAYVAANAPGAAGTDGFFRLIKYHPIYYPRRRYIINMVRTSSTVLTITTSVDHGFAVGQKVRLRVPYEFGAIEADGLIGTVATGSANATLVLNCETDALTTFVFPNTLATTGTTVLPAGRYVFHTPAEVMPVGEDTSYAIINSLDVLTDATYNSAFIGVEMQSGANSPAGSANDVMYWYASKDDRNEVL